MVKVILDTNVFIAAAFNRRSASARIIEALRSGSLQLVWDERTKAETKKLLNRIPRTKWEDFEKLFSDGGRHNTKISPESFADTIDDPDDRKFAALAKDSGAVIVTNDHHLLSAKDAAGLDVMTPGDFVNKFLSP
jgi:putative PIN family toxin of toxin-antitoxin system